jgi:hypothetical protein
LFVEAIGPRARKLQSTSKLVCKFILFVLQIGSMLIARAANADLTWHKDISSAPRVSPEFDLTLDDKAVLRTVEQLNFIQMKRKYLIISSFYLLSGFTTG